MFINYKKRYFRLLEMIEEDIRINYNCYLSCMDDMMAETIKDPKIKDMYRSNTLKSMDKFLNRHDALCDLSKKIRREF